jgi:asparagine synthase (glutamine-hydrolysing)
MCGFICVYDKNNGIKKCQSAIEHSGKKLAHRGPDDVERYYDDTVGIYFNRLSVIDTTIAGRQPMFSDDKNMVLAFNGEIYNYKELRDSLKKRGHTFRTNSDTEVLLKTYQEYGDRCTDHLRGMYAFVIWDRVKKVLTAYRDRFGIKPLYIYRGDQIIIASEIKAILAYNEQSKQPDLKTIFNYLAKGWLDDSADTFYKNIKSIPPSTVIKISPNQFKQDIYWRLTPGEGRPFNQEEVREKFVETVALHLRSDVPLAATLSGGMDSTSIVGIASKLTKGVTNLRAFSTIPPNTVDESFWINRTVDHTGIDHSYLDIDFGEMTKIIDELIKVHDEPFHSSNCIYQYLLRREIAKKDIVVLLVGEGGDEIFAGYRRLFYPYLYALSKDGKNGLYNDALKGAGDFMEASSDSILLGLDDYRKLLVSGRSGQENLSAYDILSSDFINGHSERVKETWYPKEVGQYKNYFVATLMQHLFKRDIPNILRMEDRNSMAFGIEARVPFLDHKFVELVFSYDYSEFMKCGINKAMLRKAMAAYLPTEVINRKTKSGRPGSNAHIVYDILKEEMDNIFNSKEFRKSEYWNVNCRKLFATDCIKRNNERAIAWFRLYIFMRWFALGKCT